MTIKYRCDYVPGRSPHVLLPGIASGLSSTSCLLLTTCTETATESLQNKKTSNNLIVTKKSKQIHHMKNKQPTLS